MYRNEETAVSFRYLKEVIQHLEGPLCLLGGWAVYFTVTNEYKKETGNEYLGSRDIDLGFQNIETAKKAMAKLEGLGFKQVSFRYFKEIHAETGRELSTEEAKRTPLYNIFPLYVDIIMSKTDFSLKTRLGFLPMDEPLLQPVFAGQGREITEFDRKVIIPPPQIMMAMKIRSLKGRDKEHKRIKDLCDLTALCLYSRLDLNEIHSTIRPFLTKEAIWNNLKDLQKNDLEHVAVLLGLNANLIAEVVEKLKG